MSDEMSIRFSALSENESFARSVVSAYAARLDPTIEELEDVRVSVSEAVTNAIIHGYANAQGTVEIRARTEGKSLFLEIRDEGCGIADIEKAREPFYTSRPDLERSGMGFTVMEAMMDEISVSSCPGAGTTVSLIKHFRQAQS